ncbi:AAA family ATPase [Streptomyces sp. NPDC006539]|uniref:LuxR C-terminal-related transcriptional regulator n=1 Tax=Streptomyces sp. NPDC006539 TaxID=3155352 RepID=UPI0033B14720
MKLEAEVLRGRDNETLPIDRALDFASTGIGSAIVISGGAGAGKSSLLEFAIRKAKAQGFTVLQARGSFAERDLPFGLALRLIESSVYGGNPTAASFLNGWADGVEWHEIDLCAGLDRLRRAFEMLATGTPPLLLAVDNVHWADAPSMRWLSTLPERLDHLPALAIVSVCDGLPGTNPALLEELLFTSTNQVTLSNLGYAATAQMLEDRLGEVPHPAFVAACMQAAEGNPLLLANVVDEITQRKVRPNAAAAVGLPSLVISSLAISTQVRLRRISPNALAVFRAIAVLDGQATIERIAELTAVAPTAVADDCRALTRMGMLANTPQRLRVAQPLVRNAILQESGFAAIQDIHAQAAMMLHADDVAAETVAAHMLVSPIVGQTWAVETLRAAAQSALESGDPATAVLYLQRALREPIQDSLQADIHLDIIAASCRTDIATAARSLARATTLLAPDELCTQLDPEVTTLLVLSGREEAAPLASPAQEYTSRAKSHALRGALFGTGARSVAELQDLVKQLQESAAPSSLAFGFSAKIEVLSSRSLEAAMAEADQATRLTPRSFEDLTGRLIAAHVFTLCGNLARAASVCDEAVNTANRWQDQPSLALALTSRAKVRNQLGSPRDALEDARSAFEIFQQAGINRRSTLAQLCILAMLDPLSDVGEQKEAVLLLENNGLAGSLSTSPHSVDILLHRGRLRIACGFAHEAIGDLEECGKLATEFGTDNPAVAPWRSLLAEAYMREGWHERAQNYADEEVKLARSWGAPTYLGSALRFQALAGPREGRLDLLRESLEQLRGSGASVILAQTLADYGALLSEVEENLHEARQVLREAVELAEYAGVPALAQRGLDALSAAGGRMRRKKKSGLDSLTVSERTVAGLAAAGQTNRNIAKQLFVQQRTVEVHLTNTYRKLGVDGRDQLSRFFS